ncbi:DUF1737 domain-containing protein [bacterium]|nr:DUF1737 domain-containing protein [bacterium]
MEYKIVIARDCNRLAKKVNEAITEGWVPIGGIALDTNHPEYADVVAQSMIKEGFWLEQGHKLGSFEVEKVETEVFSR